MSQPRDRNFILTKKSLFKTLNYESVAGLRVALTFTNAPSKHCVKVSEEDDEEGEGRERVDRSTERAQGRLKSACASGRRADGRARQHAREASGGRRTVAWMRGRTEGRTSDVARSAAPEENSGGAACLAHMLPSPTCGCFQLLIMHDLGRCNNCFGRFSFSEVCLHCIPHTSRHNQAVTKSIV